ncbi:MAG: GDSL-type esterase/lipase family protein, partial [Pseudomonadota bacterium]
MTRMTDAASFRRPLLAALAALALGGPALAQAQGFGPPGPPPNAPPAEVPPQVAIPRPSAAEIEAARRAFADFVAKADANTRALLQKYPSLLEVRPPAPNTAIIPALSPQFRAKHEANLEVARQGDAELLFMGDSITDFWRNAEGAYAGKAVLDKYFGQWKVANFGIAGDTTQGVLYRLQNGEGQGFKPRAVMLMIGTNNTMRNTA